MTQYHKIQQDLVAAPKTWLVTDVAGFIGSNLLETLLKLNQTVIGLDHFATGYQKNLDEVQSLVSDERWQRFRFIEGDIRNFEDCKQACSDVSKAKNLLGYEPKFNISEGINEAMAWYVKSLNNKL